MQTKLLSKELPYIYKNIYDFQELCKMEQPEADYLQSEFQLAFNRQFVVTADEKGVEYYEQLLELSSSNTDTLALRKQKIIIALTAMLPFTLNYLKGQLDRIMGENNWECTVDNNAYKLYIRGLLENDDWSFTLNVLVQKIKPANIVYVFQPLLLGSIKINEIISVNKTEWKYKLGIWKLGQYPFISPGLEVIKMASTPSIKQAFLNKSVTNILPLIHHIVLNDDLTITDFEILSAVNNKITIDFIVPPTSYTKINKLQVMSADNAVLTESEFVVTLGEATEFQIIISLYEGE